MQRSFRSDIAAIGRERRERVERAIAWKAEEWGKRYALTRKELSIFSSLAKGVSRDRVLRAEHIAYTTMKRHVANILTKTQDESVQHAIIRLLRELL